MHTHVARIFSHLASAFVVLFWSFKQYNRFSQSLCDFPETGRRLSHEVALFPSSLAASSAWSRLPSVVSTVVIHRQWWLCPWNPSLLPTPLPFPKYLLNPLTCILLECSWLTMLYLLQVYSKMNPLYICLYLFLFRFFKQSYCQPREFTSFHFVPFMFSFFLFNITFVIYMFADILSGCFIISKKEVLMPQKWWQNYLFLIISIFDLCNIKDIFFCLLELTFLSLWNIPPHLNKISLV